MLIAWIWSEYVFFCPSFPLSLRRVYVINKEICVRTVCAHEELLKGKFDRNFGKRTSNLASDKSHHTPQL